MVSYDTPEVASLKADFIAKNGFLGGMYWELSGDHKLKTGQAIVPTVASKMGVLDRRSNHLSFPRSKFENLRNGMNA